MRNASLCRMSLLAPIFAMSIVACSAKVETSNEDPNRDNRDNQGASLKPDMNGIWATPCTLEQGTTIYTISVIELTGNRFKNSVLIYTDAQCKSQIGHTSTLSGEFVLGGETAQKAIYQLDLKITEQDGSSKSELRYDIVTDEGGRRYFGEYQGLNPDSRPARLNRDRSYLKR